MGTNYYWCDEESDDSSSDSKYIHIGKTRAYQRGLTFDWTLKRHYHALKNMAKENPTQKCVVGESGGEFTAQEFLDEIKEFINWEYDPSDWC